MFRGYVIPVAVVSISAILSVGILYVLLRDVPSNEASVLAAWNPVEKVYLRQSGRQAAYAGENISVVETQNLCELGKMTALSFLFWAKDHPNGVVALQTGKTPELFLEYLKFYKENWGRPQVQQDLVYHGINLKAFPDTSQLRFVQLNEFYPVNPEQKNSMTSYIKKYYLSLFEIPEENTLFIDISHHGILNEKGPENLFPKGRVDLSLLERQPETALETQQREALAEAEQYCRNYEKKIRDWGGIGFFLGGIGPDGNIAYNLPGAQESSKTRLVTLSYPAAAAAATDLGGIEHAKNKTVITIGLETLSYNKDAVALVIAAGEGKAPVVAAAVERERDPGIPATALQGMRGAKFYVTKGAASLLQARRLEDIQKKTDDALSDEEIDDIVIGLALSRNKRIIDLNAADVHKRPLAKALFAKFSSGQRDMLLHVQQRLIAKIEKGLALPKNRIILHTEPHHDDIMLSYHAVMRKLLRNNDNYYVAATSGFNSVTNAYMLQTLDRIPDTSLSSQAAEIFRQDYASLLRRFINSAEKDDKHTMEMIESFILLKNICRVFAIKDTEGLKNKVIWLRDIYFPNQVPGTKDIAQVQMLKGFMRESEAERMLLMAGVTLPRIHHLRAKFYNGDYFNAMPTIEEDAKPLVELCQKVRPDIITVALDPEGTGPDTHYKVLQVVAQSLRMGKFSPSMRVWGYRNVWQGFKFSEANMIFPVSQNDIDKMNHAFLYCFSTQKVAAYPSPEYDGPFSVLSARCQQLQYEQIRSMLGDSFFTRHPDAAIRNAKGFILLKEMHLDEFLDNARELKSRIELVNS